ncbi:lactate racemase domain-containing protein [Actinoplanes sp. NPDC049265]|uniref:lactate racemase domain-containing protein n=1 Tax=Actinoplanes sp. NPDC049265 TaxID=3363902 RepID=UPI003718946B
MSRVGGPGRVLTDDEVISFVAESLAGLDADGRSVCVLVPDATRVCPLPLLVGAVHRALHGRVSRLTVLVALGTHPAMTALDEHVGGPYPDTVVINHEWWDPATFADLGTIPSGRIEELSAGRMTGDVRVRLNRAVVDHDIALVVGPVLPHEVVGMSGGNKYFFPGVAGQEIIDVSHWLGALITSAEIIGTTGTTPVRALIDDGAALIPAACHALSVVTAHEGGLHSVSFGDCVSSWADAASVSAATHVTYLDQPVDRVLSLVPEMYGEIWTGAKGFYKVEPVVADGGEVILYAPHIRTLADSHPQIYEVGYHCRDYFTEQWERFSHIHWGVLAHSTHLRGAGTWSAADGERLRVNVTLATSIPPDVCAAVNLGYRDPGTIDVAGFDGLVVPRAGEMLFRLR